MTVIRKGTDGDLSAACRTYARAFVSDPVIRWLIPDDDEYEAMHQQFFSLLVRRFLAGGTLWCTDDVVALAGWNPPGRPEFDVETVRNDDLFPQWRLDRLAALRTEIGENTPIELHWHLNMIGTHPDWQRRGLAGALMATTFDIADSEGVPCWLETETSDNVAYYRHHGFEVISEWDVPLDGPHMWGMSRPAR